MRILSSFIEDVLIIGVQWLDSDLTDSLNGLSELDYDWFLSGWLIRCVLSDLYTEYPGDHRDIVPPDPISNSVVKSVIADDSVGFPHVKVGHYQVLYRSPD